MNNGDMHCLRSRWLSMHKRCLYGRGNYGKLGITVCKEWSGDNGFENFAEWSLKNGFSSNLMIDRKDTYGPYSPDNCRWITKKENNRNKTTTVFVLVDGVKTPLTQYCENRGLDKKGYARLYYRVRHSPQMVELSRL